MFCSTDSRANMFMIWKDRDKPLPYARVNRQARDRFAFESDLARIGVERTRSQC